MEQAETNLNAAPSRWVHYLAIACAIATFPLVVVGGLVTTARVGMADPDWPTPPWYFVWLVSAGKAMDRGLGFFIEHGHRQLGWIVGALTVALAASLWIKETRPWLRKLGLVAVAAVILQGVLGGLRVLFVNQALAWGHGILAQLFFSFMVCLAVFTGRRWLDDSARLNSPSAIRLRRLAMITTLFVVLQLVFGATLRHFGYTWALVAHLTTAFIIVVHVALIAKRVFTECSAQPQLVGGIERLGILVLAQLMLGAGAWSTATGFGLNVQQAQSGAQMFFATAHVAIGALILAGCVTFTVQVYRQLVPCTQSDGAPDDRRGRSKSFRPSVSGLESRELWMSGVNP